MGAKAIIAVILLVVIIIIVIANINIVAMMAKPHAPDEINAVMQDPELTGLSDAINATTDEFALELDGVISDYRGTLVDVAPNQDDVENDINDTILESTKPVINITNIIPTISKSHEMRIEESKILMLDLINEERTNRGLSPVSMGNNSAAQSHADKILDSCYLSHWDLKGTKPYMRYTTAGGHQYNAENISGGFKCYGHEYRVLSHEENIRESMDGFMNSPGHRDNILNPHHAFVNIGVAQDGANFRVVQHFEYNYVDFIILPTISNNMLKFALSSELNNEYSIQMFYDPLPAHDALTPNQVTRTECYSVGESVASFREQLSGGWYYPDDNWSEYYYPECRNPYDVPRGPAIDFHIPPPVMPQPPYVLTVPWITAGTWNTSGDKFVFLANISNVLKQHGNGVYTIMVFNGDIPITEYAIFYDG